MPLLGFSDGGRKKRKEEKREKEKKSMIIVVPSSDRLTACTATLGPIVHCRLVLLKGDFVEQHNMQGITNLF